MEKKDKPIIIKKQINDRNFSGEISPPEELGNCFTFIFNERYKKFEKKPNVIPNRKIFRSPTSYLIYHISQSEISVKEYTKAYYEEEALGDSPDHISIPYDLSLRFDFLNGQDDLNELGFKEILKTFGDKTTYYDEIVERVVKELNLIIKSEFSEQINKDKKGVLGAALNDISEDIKRETNKRHFFKKNFITITGFYPNPSMNIPTQEKIKKDREMKTLSNKGEF